MAAISLIETMVVLVLAATPVEGATRIRIDALFRSRPQTPQRARCRRRRRRGNQLIERRAGPAAAWQPGLGYSFIEVVFVAGLAATIALVALPNIQRMLDEFRAVGATRYLAARLARTRSEALARSTDAALRFVRVGPTYRYGAYIDGNANGVRSADITNGIDRLISPEERLGDQFAGVDFGVLPGLPAPEGSNTAPGVDPVRLGTGDIATFSPQGTATPGSLYILGPHAVQLMIRIVGETGRTRILKFDARNRNWKPL